MRVGDVVTAGGEGGRVTSVRRNNVEVEPDSRPGSRFWYSATDVILGAPPPKPTIMAKRYGDRGEELRPVCKHTNLAQCCEECLREAQTGGSQT